MLVCNVEMSCLLFIAHLFVHLLVLKQTYVSSEWYCCVFLHLFSSAFLYT